MGIIYKKEVLYLKNNIRKFRKNNCLNIFELSDRTNISYSYLSALENNIKCNPSYDIIIKLLNYFNCSFEELFPQD